MDKYVVAELNRINAWKENMKAALNHCGIDVSDLPITEWAKKIRESYLAFKE